MKKTKETARKRDGKEVRRQGREAARKRGGKEERRHGRETGPDPA